MSNIRYEDRAEPNLEEQILFHKEFLETYNELHDSMSNKTTEEIDALNEIDALIQKIQADNAAKKIYTRIELDALVEKINAELNILKNTRKDGVYLPIIVNDVRMENLQKLGVGIEPQQINLLEKADKLIQRIDKGMENAGRTNSVVALKNMIENSTIGDNALKKEIIKAIVTDEIQRKNSAQKAENASPARSNNEKQSLIERAKISFKSHARSKRHHPEMTVLALLSKVKDGDTPQIHRHNSQILEKIMGICEKELNKAMSNYNASVNTSLQDYKMEIVPEIQKAHSFMGLDSFNEKANTYTLRATPKIVATQVIADSHAKKDHRFLATIYLYANDAVNSREVKDKRFSLMDAINSLNTITDANHNPNPNPNLNKDQYNPNRPHKN